MSDDTIVDLNPKDPPFRTAQDIVRYFSRRDVLPHLKNIMIVSQDDDNLISIAYSEMEPGELCFLTMYVQQVIMSGLTDSE